MRELHHSIKDNQDIAGRRKSKIQRLPLSSMWKLGLSDYNFMKEYRS